AWRRGSRYFRNRAATLEQAEALEGGGLLLTGTCTGSMPQPYVQRIEIRDTDGALSLVGQCSCPVGRNCKHVVAQILTWQATAAYSDEDPDAVSDWLNQMPDESGAGGNVRPSIRYLLNFHDSFEIRLAFEITRPLKDGRPGKPRRLSSMPNASPQIRPGWMNDIDAEIIALANACRLETGRIGVALTGSLGALTLDKIVATGQAFEDDQDPDRETPLRVGPPRRMEIEWKRTRSGYQAQVSMEGGTVELPLDPPRYVDSDAGLVGPLVLPQGVGHDVLDWLRGSPVIPKERAAALSRRLARTLPTLPTPVAVEMADVDGPPTPCLNVHFQPANPRMAWAQLSFDYEGVELTPELDREAVVSEVGERLVRIHRDPDFEQAALEQLLGTGMVRARGEPGRMRLDVDDDFHAADAWFEWLQTTAPGLEAQGWRITQPGGDDYSLEHAQGLEGELEDRNSDWFDLRFDLELKDGRRVPFLPLVTGLLQRYSPGSMPETVYLSLGRDQYVAISSGQIAPVLDTILDLFDDSRPDHLRLARPDSPRLLDLGNTPIRGATQVRALAQKLRDFKGVDPVKLPTTFKGELRPYQQHGVEWIQFLRKHGLAGVLADDMGLGKTVQTLAHLAVEKRAGRMTLPSLIVAPTSLMGNWRREAELFTPGLK
ncbi:MAG: SNF2-related protein, partial [Wenzhouxiangellaceae bacterium]